MTTPQRPWQPVPQPPLHMIYDDSAGASLPPGTVVPKVLEDFVNECRCGGPAGHVPGGVHCRRDI